MPRSASSTTRWPVTGQPARLPAKHLGHSNVVRLLQMTLDEEKETDQQLTQLAEESINVKAEASVGAGGRAWDA